MRCEYEIQNEDNNNHFNYGCGYVAVLWLCYH